MVKQTATIKKPMSRAYVLRSTRNSRTKAIEPGANAGDEAGGADELANSHARAVGAHGGESAEDIGRAIAKGKEGDGPARLSLRPRTAAMVLRLTLKKSLAAMPMVVNSNPQPYDEKGEGHGLCIAEGAVVELQVGEEPGIVVGAVPLDEGALVVDRVYLAALARVGAAVMSSEKSVACIVRAALRMDQKGVGCQ